MAIDALVADGQQRAAPLRGHRQSSEDSRAAGGVEVLETNTIGALEKTKPICLYHGLNKIRTLRNWNSP